MKAFPLSKDMKCRGSREWGVRGVLGGEGSWFVTPTSITLTFLLRLAEPSYA